MTPAPRDGFDYDEVAPWELQAKLTKLHEATVDFLGAGYDLDAINATIAVAAGDRIDGDPAWLLAGSPVTNALTSSIARSTLLLLGERHHHTALAALADHHPTLEPRPADRRHKPTGHTPGVGGRVQHGRTHVQN